MRQKLSELRAPAVAGVIREKTIRAAIAEIKNCTYDGADMIDLHLSCLEQCDIESLRQVINATNLPILALNYNRTYEWADRGLTEQERMASFLCAVEAGAAGVDMQGYSFQSEAKDGFVGEDKYPFTKGNPKEIVTDPIVIKKQRQFIEKVHSMGAEVLLSCHPGIPMNAEAVVALAHFLDERGPDIIKIVTRADTEEDLAESIRAMLLLKKEIKTPVSYHTNGKAGTLSRIINPLLGGQIAFCVDRYNEGSTMEQIDLRTTKRIVENVWRILNA